MDYCHRLLIFLMGLSLFVFRGSSQGVCPKNWWHIRDSCYKISSRSLAWNAAKSTCEALGSKLAMVKSQAELQALVPKMSDHVWIGLYRDPKDTSRFLWVDKTRVTYTHWNTGEPNNHQGRYEGCVEMFPPAGKWNDAECGSPRRCLCEIKVNCPVLTVSRFVKTFPNSCVTSQMKFNTKCSFRCPKGYQLQGPSYKQCKRNGQWTDSSKNVSCEVKCPTLTISRFVKAFPNRCVTSKMKFNTKCSFRCPKGYQLQGPSYKQCKRNGQWTDSSKNVSCEDIDECSLTKNGGCSHKCVNTAGSYKCECPDPEMSLSPDNSTCHASGVEVQCNSNNMTITIPKSLLRGLDREHLRLLDTKCKARETSAYFSLTTPLDGCNTARRQTPASIVYSNEVSEIPVVAKDLITRVREIQIKFNCFYSKYGVVSSVGWKPSNRKLLFSDEANGNFTLSLSMFPDKRFVSPYTKDNFPVALVLRKLLFFEVSVTSSDKRLSIIAERCYATPTQNKENRLKYEFITKRCPSDVTVKYYSAPLASAQRFSLEAFKFIADHPFVFVHCDVIVCNASDPDSICNKDCPSSGRGRRTVSDQKTDDIYSLVQGPIYLAREKRQESSEKVAKSGSSPALIMVLSVMCAACLAGTVLMVFKKARDQSAEYTALSSTEQG